MPPIADQFRERAPVANSLIPPRKPALRTEHELKKA